MDTTSNIYVKQANIVSQKLENLQEYSQRQNLIFEGVLETPKENGTLLIEAIIAKHLGLPYASRYIDKAHRLGLKPTVGNKPRPTIVRFTSQRSKEAVFGKRTRFAGTGIWVKKHLPDKLQRDENLMTNVLRIAREADQSARVVQGAKLLYKGRKYDTESVRSTEIPVIRLHQKENDNTICFQGKFSPLSNFYNCKITQKGVTYSSMEQLYHANRAHRHNDMDTLAAILLESDPVEIKQISKRVCYRIGYDPKREAQEDLRVMEEDLRAKLLSGSLKDFLLATGTKRIVEASQYDNYWGSGVGLRHKQCLDQNLYTGKNVLGGLLEKVRAVLSTNETHDKTE